MKKGILFILLISFLFLSLAISSVSAVLCRGNDGYYHDCNINRYRYDNYENNIRINTIRLGFNDNYNYFNNRDIRSDYNNLDRSPRTYYITYDNERSHYRTYDNYNVNYNYDRYNRNYDNRYNSRSRTDRRAVVQYANRNRDRYDNERYYQRNRYVNYYDYDNSPRRSNYVVWELKKDYSCPEGWSCTSKNKIYL